MTPLLLWCGAIAGPLFILVFLIEGLVRPGYLPFRQPVSALAIGPRGWIQRTNFFVNGALALAYAFGLYSALQVYGGSLWVPMLIALYAFGLFGAGYFITDITGLEPAKTRTKNGVLHDAFSLPVFAGVFAACFVFAHIFYVAHESGWTWYSVISALLLFAFFALAGAGFAGRSPFARMGGLMQRISIITGWAWLSLVALHLLGSI